ncbi:MaoC family dehydratase [Euzebya tangerina]|uniref:MaoC family dehydratase n=1 Tax=Euzebya tangerina TaxID=591198 RepID=UPI000E324052|nr:MaoC family dehydratase [Euzebya tangerina]
MPVTMTKDELAAASDVDLGTSEWIRVDQAMIELFADATRDHQWIHVDHDKAAQGPFGQTIAHGFLTVSLLPEMLGQMLSVEGSVMGVNYGMDRLRLTSPVPSGARIRARGTILSTEPKGEGILVRTEMTVEIEGQEKPAMIGVFLTLRY